MTELTGNLATCEFCSTVEDVHVVWWPVYSCLPCWDKKPESIKEKWREFSNLWDERIRGLDG